MPTPRSSTTLVEDAPARQPNRVRAIMGACSGNLVEWYDFFIYAYTAIYFAASFFPKGDTTTQLLATAGVFAVGFFMRPLGGWIFGWLADTRGRKVSMIISVFMMCAGSLLIAVMPTYETVGIAAPIMLVVARLIQGLSVGAEYGTGATYISEIATPGRRCFYGSFQYFTIIAGQLLALFTVVILQQTLSDEQLREWGWRIPFFIGAISAVVVVYLRRSMHETASKKDMHREGAGSLRGMFKHKRAVGLVIAFTIGGSLYFYTFTTYMQKFLVISAGFDAATVSFIMTSALIGFMLCQPLFGLMADRLGIRTHMLMFSSLGVLLVIPLLFAIKHTHNPFMAFALVFGGLVIASLYTPIAGIVKAELFPPAVRALGVGFPYAIGNAAFGGTAEYVALSFRAEGAEDYFFFYVAAVLCVTFIASMLMPNLTRHGYISGDGRVEENTGMPASKVQTAKA
ncbi:MFS family transporter [Pseudomonas kermanshahensis]|jgi:MHS family alpha-ketoglutarate permease-like MFS transporter|uniref:MFS family transporter n=1 Tax=Pseudomonas kermanshahensis TaxID=2745482 RepID=A0ABU8R014_9PSED|nr:MULTISPECIES: MFS family transporter [Pseudomonas]ATP50217.1 alpha-ketoglutarate permease [Pseudomonas putida]MBC3485624.1 MFS transporter [Pseudomonas sp. SWRI50]MDE4537390.1 MFS transporter [Pseudomonas sp. ITEM 17296]WEL53056.1 MFS family transporter [Pseudomonas kermanshahensis]SMF19126.1 MFS transporter, MHS family, alpha-ketoglutarate permease [Pseudomonas sp. LAIL14HWK12:I11]